MPGDRWLATVRAWLLWSGDGRITAGHLAVLAERAAAGPLEVVLFNGMVGADWDWSDRDKAMAGRLLAAAPAQARTLAVAGNAHPPTGPTQLGVPMGAWLNRQLMVAAPLVVVSKWPVIVSAWSAYHG